MLNLLRRQAIRDAPFVVAVMAILCAFEYLVCAMVGSIDVEGAFGEITRFAPAFLRELIERNMPGASPAGVLSFGWNHPVWHALLGAVAVALGARAIAGEIESGAIELVMAQPLSRGEYFGAHLAWGMLAIAASLGAATSGTVLGQWAFGLVPFGAARLVALVADAFLLQLCVYGVALLASSLSRETGRAALMGVLAAVMSFLVNAVASLWTRAAFAKPYSLHHYYQPREILVDGVVPYASLATLGVLSSAVILAAFVIFRRRDLP